LLGGCSPCFFLLFSWLNCTVLHFARKRKPHSLVTPPSHRRVGTDGVVRPRDAGFFGDSGTRATTVSREFVLPGLVSGACWSWTRKNEEGLGIVFSAPLHRSNGGHTRQHRHAICRFQKSKPNPSGPAPPRVPVHCCCMPANAPLAQLRRTRRPRRVAPLQGGPTQSPSRRTMRLSPPTSQLLNSGPRAAWLGAPALPFQAPVLRTVPSG
jgi:hypothetical protein